MGATVPPFAAETNDYLYYIWKENGRKSVYS